MQLNPSDIQKWKDKIRKMAEEEGFLQIGFTRPDENDKDQLKELYTSWIDKKYHAGMQWFETTIEQRIDIKKYFHEVESIIVFLISYYHPEPQNWGEVKWKIARYAHGKDYHKVLRKKLNKIARQLSIEIQGFKFKITVDSSPMAERYWARKAGLGWIGRNSMLISPKYGSFTFLATMITNVPLPPDPPFEKNLCGKCDKCISSCPTSAILPDKTVDSNRCISYLSIEHSGEINDELLKKFNGWIFGCDICQEVCPWNSRKVDTPEPRFRDQYLSEQVEQALSNQEEFDRIFAGTPVRRAGYQHFKYVYTAVTDK